MIDGAPALFGIQKLTHFLEDVVFLMAEYWAVRRFLGVAPLGLVVRNTEVIRYAQQIAFGYIDAIIAAAISGALVAVVQHPQRASALLCRSILCSTHYNFLESLQPETGSVLEHAR